MYEMFIYVFQYITVYLMQIIFYHTYTFSELQSTSIAWAYSKTYGVATKKTIYAFGRVVAV